MKKDNKVRKIVSGNSETENITRKKAIKKAGKYAALTALTSLIILSPKQGQAASLPQKPGNGW